MQRLGKGWECITNHSVSELGRIWVIWDPRYIRFEVRFVTDQAIHGKAILGNGNVVHLSFIYGHCDYRNRRDLWKELIFNSKQIASAPWLILGDFNVSRHPQEQLHGSPKFSKAMNEFNNCFNLIEVEDIRGVGRFFTWSNKRDGIHTVYKKLDRVLGNWGWHNVYNHSFAQFHNPGVSDHSPISVTLAVPGSSGCKPFKFLKFWTEDSRFLEMVRRVWSQRSVGNPLEVVICKLRNLKRELKLIFRRSNPCTRRETIRKEIDTIQSNILHQPTDPALLLQEKDLIAQLWRVSAEEESFLKQKSRINWLKLGDANNKFFHRAVTSSHHRNHISRLQKQDGSWACSQIEVEKIAVEHFEGFLGSQPTHSSHSSAGYSKKFTEEQKTMMSRGFKDNEIRGAFWGLNPDKAPGPDGFNGHFFRAAWDIVGKEMIAACRFLFDHPYMPKGLNATIIALVPKSKNASRISD
ncbi:Exo_endo_phos domain-containing protein [Cephalotus follicularis]|uniref:Exo_endo_phos domain-containing protein n=1 Tax=Cephalotus follicularis TaxID=3775 RepID=A0A1Q3DJW1_CEPFO|nr:Exo_endo_phos domain-containing protein [Cephalotus follicularis]